MGSFFGTDGIRWKVGKESSCEIAFRCGNSLGEKNKKILIGRDTRNTGFLITLLFASGVIQAGGTVIDVGVCPTAGISYLTKKQGFDYGVVVSASHNPAEYNGIKIFDSNGVKLGDSRECDLEKGFFKNKFANAEQIGMYEYCSKLVKDYETFLVKATDFKINKKIVLDCSNGAASMIAPRVFKKLGAQVIAVSCRPNGQNINKGCGVLNIQNLQKLVLNHEADMGFAFDGDSDRVLAVDENGIVVDGDKMIYMFASSYQKQGKLSNPQVVGTTYTNIAVESALKHKGINLLRAEVGDKYVSKKLNENNLLIGGEPSGHIFVKDKLQTGDGILNAILIASMCESENKKLSEFFDYKPLFQYSKNIHVENKTKIIESERLASAVVEIKNKLAGKGRLIVRASGTESLIRVTIECEDKKIAEKHVEKLTEIINKLNMEIVACVE